MCASLSSKSIPPLLVLAKTKAQIRILLHRRAHFRLQIGGKASAYLCQVLEDNLKNVVSGQGIKRVLNFIIWFQVLSPIPQVHCTTPKCAFSLSFFLSLFIYLFLSFFLSFFLYLFIYLFLYLFLFILQF